AIEEIRRVLKLRGLFHLFVPCEGEVHTLHGLLARVGWRAKEAYGGHIRRFTKQDAERLLREQGFTVTGSRWSGHLLNQIVDVVYFTCLQVLRKNLGTSVEGYIERPGAGIVSG
ncbi:MAG: hypothetical protein GTO63_13195, partial [Anaerolineae bacterium]|nr:hypothetical protein [Anaerolineae bacterium]NIN95799.1 hypothetical protein [Anaerolineae bacterium]